MADFRDDSLLFSLRGLLPVDKEKAERAAAERRLDEALRRERERLIREADERKRLNMLEAARLAELRQREEEARIEALRVATVECARVEAEGRARLEIMAKQQEHDRRMLLIGEESKNRRLRQLAMTGFAAAALVLSVSLAVYFGKFRPESIRLQSAYDELVWAERNRAEETKRLLERTEKRRVETQADLDVARARITKLEKALENSDDKPPPSK